jgi:MFS family permease
MCSWFGRLDLFLYGFIVPILPYMLQERVKLGHDKAQAVTSNLLALYSLSQVVSSPIVGVIADRMPERKTPMLVALVFGLASTALMAVTTSSEAPVIGCSRYRVFS